MALFSRRKKSDDVVEEASVDVESDAVAPAEESTAEEAAAVPAVNISVQAFRGVGAEAGPQVSLPDPDAVPASRPAPAAAPTAPKTPAARPVVPEKRVLPLAPALPPEQTESVPGMKDNVLLRTALAEIEAGATNEQLLGVLRQMLQGHLYLRVHGDARTQISEGKPLSIAVVRDGERSYMLAFSSAVAVRDSVQRETEPTATSAVAQPVTAVLQQVVAGGFSGIILDNASGAHRAVFPIEILTKALEQADEAMTIKALLAAPREQDTAHKVGEALATTKVWVAVNDGSGSGQVGIAEAQTADGKRYLQVFTHPLEIVALGRGDKPMPFEPAQLGKTLAAHTALEGVLVDAAGPSIMVPRDALAPVIVRGVDIAD